jgi:hypothetical protein
VSLLSGVELSSTLAGLQIGGATAQELSSVLDFGPSDGLQGLTLLDSIKLAAASWDREIDYRALNETDNLLSRLYWLLALAQASEIDREMVAFDGVVLGAEGLRFYRQVLSRLPDGAEETTLADALPREVVLRQGTGLVVVAGSDEGWLVCFSEDFDRGQTGVQPLDTPRLYLALISDDDLAALLGERYEAGTGHIQFVGVDGGAADWAINTLGADLGTQVESATGLAWADQQPDGNWFPDPVVPYPPQGMVSQLGDESIQYGHNAEEGIWEGSVVTEDGTERLALISTYQEGNPASGLTGAWEWHRYFAMPSWGQEMIPSNAIGKYNEAANVWELYSTSRIDPNSETGEGLYIASIEGVVGQDGNETGRYCRYTEGPLYPNDHLELFVKESWEEIGQRMQETGVGKVLFFDIEQVDYMRVKRYPSSQNLPLALVTYFKYYPVDIYYPYITESQVVPAVSPRTQLAILEIGNNQSPIVLKVFGDEFDIFTQPTTQSERIITDEENLVGEYGTISSLGRPILRINGGYISLLGRSVIYNNYNRMLLDTLFKMGKEG